MSSDTAALTANSAKLESGIALRSAVIEALTRVYDSVWLISDIESQKFELYRIDEEDIHVLPAQKALNITKFSDALSFYSAMVCEEDRQGFLDAVSLDMILKNTEDKLIYSVPFRRVFVDAIRHYRLEFARLDLGGTVGIVGGFKNVDDEVRKERQVQEALNLRSAVIEALTRVYDSVWMISDLETQKFELYRIDEETSHLLPAREALSMMRFSDALVFYSNLVLDEDRKRFLESVTQENIIKNTEHKILYSVPFRRVFESGVRHYRLEFARLELDDDRFGIVGGFKDVDEEVRKEQKVQQTLRDAIETANASSKAKSEFLASMSHDMRTPMNGIIGMTALAEKNLDDKEKVADCLRKIAESSNHLLSLINDVLDMNKIESGKVELREEDFYLAELVDGMLTMVMPQIQARGHSFELDAADVDHEHVMGDPGRIKQVFVNIMSNAVKYTPDGGEISLSIGELPTGIQGFSHYQFVFEDNGFGMTEEFQRHLFEPFTRAEDKQIAGIQGTGLGMAITSNIVRMMGGSISVESTYGKGSKFTVNLYLRHLNGNDAGPDSYRSLRSLAENGGFGSTGSTDELADGAVPSSDGSMIGAEPAELKVAALEELNLSGYRVLLAEDNELNAEIAMSFLEITGLEVDWAKDGQQAVDKLSESPDGYYSMIIMDVRMPNLTGIEATKAIRSIDRPYARNIPIVAMTANAFAEDVLACKNAGMNEHIKKPIDVSALARVLDTYVK